MMQHRYALIPILAITLIACNDNSLPTIGRTQGDFPMQTLLHFDSENQCYRFVQNVLFEAPFADGMAYPKDTCLESAKKIGRKTSEEVAALHVSLTYNGEYYIVKSGY